MANNLFNSMRQQYNPMEQLAQQAREFKKQFTGNPRQEVEMLLRSGKMSQAQFNQYSQIAQQVAQMMGNN
jgi:predicted amidophosphoribosyltransferase